MRITIAYITLTYIYNSKLWTLMKKGGRKIDKVQRNIPSLALGIHWSKKTASSKLCDKITKQKI